MRIAYALRILPAVLVAALAVDMAAQEPPLPAAREIVDQVIARARQVEGKKLQQQYTYKQRFVTERLDEQGQIKERDESVYQPVWIDGARYLQLVERNSRPLSDKDLEQQQKREREFRKRLAAARKKKEAAEDFRFDEELVSKYRAEVLGREQVNGRAAYVLRFEPKSDRLPARRRFDRLLSRMAGKLWIDAQEYEVVKAEGHLLGPVKWGWGVVAHISKLDFQIEQARMDDATWLLRRMDTWVQGRVVFSRLNQRQQGTWSDFRREPQAGASASH